ncbi:MAG: 3-deoxy-7-phosphoheptulonate synthase [Firmicutes bacterium]|nr:3-deoxy-7-phosphoheptulonate synthase [Bacillota bacterium]MBQ3611586.1 3-deoxy-7-phosphoheptulonate synthase [Bacillota bacterium]
MEQRSQFIRKLPMPVEIKEQYPLTEAVKRIKLERDEEIAKIFKGESDKFLLVIGPCSADIEESVMDYVCRLAKIQDQVKDKLILVPRIYTNKPRTTGLGYKGLMHQPDPEGEEDVLEGIIAMRRLHTKAIEETGLTSADEMLYPENYKYLDDLLSYVAVGARSVENQQHRLTASGMNVPVGMKNPTSGGLSVMLNSIIAAQSSHKFIYRGWEVKSQGNPLAHAVLRGSVNKRGQNIPNYHYEDLRLLHELYSEQNLENMAVVIDTNHNNSGKKYLEQIRIAQEVMNSRKYNDDIRKMVKGLMIESYIEDGAQKIGEHIYGKSITDPCLGWEKSEKLILDIAEEV